MGRFIQPDTIIPSYANPQSLNRFSYVLNSPTNLNDPTGHMGTGDCGQYGEECSPPGSSNGGGDAGGNPEEHPHSGSSGSRKVCVQCHKAETPILPGSTPTPVYPPTLPMPNNYYPTPTATPYPGPIITSSTQPLPHLSMSITVDSSNVDKIDAAIDGTTVVADFVTIGALLLGQPEVAVRSEILGDVVGAVGIIKSGVDAYNSYKATGTPGTSGLLKSAFQWALTKATRRGYGELPLVGTGADALNLYSDLHPVITIQWSNK